MRSRSGVVYGLLRRLAWPTELLLLCASRPEPDGVEPDAPGGFRLVRVGADAADAAGAARTYDLIADAMRAAGEPDGLVAPRLAHGDQFFGWTTGACIVSFGWVMTRDRVIGPFRLTDAPGRMFLYNFHTVPAYRGRGLFPALLGAMRSVLGHETAREFVIDVDVRNIASRRGLEKAGFEPVARVSFLTLLRHWRYPLRRTRLGRHAISLV